MRPRESPATPSRLLIPILGYLAPRDARLAALAQFSGVECETMPLHEILRIAKDPAVGSRQWDDACLVINTAVLKESCSESAYTPEILDILTDVFRSVLVHGCDVDSFTASLVAQLSNGKLGDIGHAQPGACYTVSADSGAFSGALGGLTFGPVRSRDRVFHSSSAALRAIASIGQDPVLVAHSRNQSNLIFLAGCDLADLGAPVDLFGLEPYFGSVALPILALRALFGDRCWRLREHHASLIIDDPALWKRFGFIKFDRVIEMLDEHRFHMSIAFIPYNHRRSSKIVAEMFRSRPDRLSLCYHGNDHTSGEFMSNDLAFLNSALRIATSRMLAHEARTGVHHDRIMVFPQSRFSTHAMDALRTNNFVAAINSGGWPQDEPNPLIVADVIAPAIMKFRGFPLFFRKYPQQLDRAEIALHHFFGKPLLIGEHHGIFKQPDLLVSLVSRIRSVVPETRWTNPQSAVEDSSLYRRARDGSMRARVYANGGVLRNGSTVAETYLVERPECSENDIDYVALDGQQVPYEVGANGFIQVACTLGSGECRKLHVVYRDNAISSRLHAGICWRTHVFARRRISDIRDMYFSRNDRLVSAAQTLRQRLLGQ